MPRLVRSVRNGKPCIIRPISKRDEVKLQQFFQAVPEQERLFIKKRPTDIRVVREWCLKSDFEKNLVLLLLDGNRVAGEVTLHQRQGGWKRHIGVVTVLTHPDYRGVDAAKILVEQIIDETSRANASYAFSTGLAEIVPVPTGVIQLDLSAAVFRNWSTDRDSVGQDWKLWCERGYLDFLCPSTGGWPQIWDVPHDELAVADLLLHAVVEQGDLAAPTHRRHR